MVFQIRVNFESRFWPIKLILQSILFIFGTLNMCKSNPQNNFCKFKSLIFLRIRHFSDIGHSVCKRKITMSHLTDFFGRILFSSKVQTLVMGSKSSTLDNFSSFWSRPPTAKSRSPSKVDILTQEWSFLGIFIFSDSSHSLPIFEILYKNVLPEAF